MKSTKTKKSNVQIPQKDIIRIMGVDPGIKNMGVCIGEYNTLTHTLQVLHLTTFVGMKFLSTQKEIKKKFIQSFCILQGLKHYLLEEFLPLWKPDCIVCEGAFYNPRFPQAHQALVLAINLIRECAYHYHQEDIILIAPMMVKNILTGKGAASKEAIQEAVRSHSSILFSPLTPLPLTEHEYDAVAHTYAFTQLYLNAKGSRINEQLSSSDETGS